MCRSMVDIQSPIVEIRRGKKKKLEMWANAQRDGRPGEYRWRPTSTPQSLADVPRVPCSNEIHHIVGTCGGDIAV